MGNNINTGKRTLYLDILRIGATLAVIFFHQLGVAENPAIPWSEDFSLICSGITRWSVPIFVMISGSLFLDNSRELSMKKLYGKNILRIVTAFVFWAVVYAVYNYSTPIFFLEGVIMGRYHMWFLLMIVGLYMITPLLRKITADKKLTEYFLVLGVIFGIGVFTFNMSPLGNIAPGVSGYVFNEIGLNFFADYAFFFVLGYYLSKFDLGKKINIALIICGALGCICSIVITVLTKNNENAPFYYSHFFLPVTLECVGVFLVAKNYISKVNFSQKWKKIILAISKYSFGMYLVHDLIITMIHPWISKTLGDFPPVALLIATAITIIASLIVSVIFNHIPVLKKYVV